MRRNLVLFQTHFLCAPSRPFRFQETNISFRESANISFCGLYRHKVWKYDMHLCMKDNMPEPTTRNSTCEEWESKKED